MPTGAVRCSLGWCSTRADVDAVVAFLGSAFCNGIAPAIDDALAWALNHAAPSSSSSSSTRSLSTTAVVEALPPAAESHPPSSPRHSPLSSPSIEAVPQSPPSAPPSLVLQELWVYPVKSCAGLRAKHWPVVMHGHSDSTANYDQQSRGDSNYAHANSSTPSPTPSSSSTPNTATTVARADTPLSKACLLLDRAFVVVDARSRLPLRARQYPLLAHCFPSIDLATGTVIF